jgi:RNA polymerase sigma-70 factor (ECF subfamily)
VSADAVDAAYRQFSRRVLATLIRLVGDFDRAEEGMADAFAAAAETWPRDGVPAHPFSWLVSTGRFKAIDRIRRAARQDALSSELAKIVEGDVAAPDSWNEETIADDRLRLIFTCCHPALPAESQVALTLREVGGLTTEEVAAAFLAPVATIAQRIVRAKGKIRDEGIPYAAPEPGELPGRLEQVLAVIYLIFNEGYAASSGSAAMRPDLAAEAIRLGRLLVELLPDPEVLGLLALMHLQNSRRRARQASDGALVLFEDQDRRLWDMAQVEEGLILVAKACAKGEVGSYTLQAAIAAEHARAESVDWHRVVALYDHLMRAQASTVVALNRAVAIGMRDGPQEAIRIIDRLIECRELKFYQPAHVARAELLRRAGLRVEASEAFAQALGLGGSGGVRSFIERRLAELN